MEDLDYMKKMWRELNDRISVLEEENRQQSRNIIRNNYKTTQERLVRKYSMFILVEIIMLVYISLFITYNPFVDERYRIVTLVYWVIFFLFEMAIDIYLRSRIKDLDIYNSSVKEIASIAAQNWKLHKIGIMIGLPLAFGALILFGFLINANKYIILGMITGAVVGFIIGCLHLKKFYDYYRFLQSND